MVIMIGIDASRDLYPMIINIEQKNSAKVARISDNSGPKPMGSGKLKSPLKSLSSFGNPCVSIKKPTANLNISKAMFITNP